MIEPTADQVRIAAERLNGSGYYPTREAVEHALRAALNPPEGADALPPGLYVTANNVEGGEVFQAAIVSRKFPDGSWEIRDAGYGRVDDHRVQVDAWARHPGLTRVRLVLAEPALDPEPAEPASDRPASVDAGEDDWSL